MSTLTHCRLVSRRYLILDRRTFVRCLIWFAFITALLILHLWTEFRIRDLKIQTQILQHYQLSLLDYNKGLRSEVYELEQDGRLREIARQTLNMHDTKPFEIEYMKVPESLLEHYNTIDVGMEIANFNQIEEYEAEESGILQRALLRLSSTSAAEQDGSD